MRRDEESDGVTFALLNWQPKKANEIWLCADWTTLCQHLHNGNEPKSFIMGFRKDGCKTYVRSKTKPASRAISWAWSTIVGKAKSKLAFAPYSTNERQESRWGAMDFDAHNGETERARELAFAAFRCLLNRPELFVILESSGSGGWHVWAISEDFRPAAEWICFLKSVARLIGATLQAGTCEIFPPDSTPTRYGKGMRAPGCWNPSTDTLSDILWQNCEPLISHLSGNSKSRPLITKDLQVEFPDRERSISFSSLSTPQQFYREKVWLEEFAITQPGTRNHRLAALVGEVFYQIGRSVAERFAELQFQNKAVATNASLQEHLESFGELWCGLEECWQAALSGAERRVFQTLETENERDAFRIIRSFALKAAQESAADFPVARDSLASRLGITGAGAAKIREKLVRLGGIQKTADYKPNRAATRFKWLLA
ncbi:MAG: hypothetical protein HY674_16505 [Chloroflexi bacterium]|nr:hypothetical protein [Chloroflexota bacterium]